MGDDRNDASICVYAPAPILTVTIEVTPDGGEELHVHPGGQGFWVGRMARLLGARVVLCAPLGGETGSVLGHLIAGADVELRATPVAYPSGAYIHDRRSGDRQELWRAKLGPLRRHEVDDLYTATLAAALECGVCVLTGTDRQGSVVPPEVYTRIAADLQANSVTVICDAQGELLRAALAGGVDLVKVSEEEITEDGWARSGQRSDLAAGIRELVEAGAADVVVSRAEGGALAYLAETWLEGTAPEMSAVDPTGAGDSMTAALAFACSRGLRAEDMLRLGLAAGAVNVTRHGLGTGDAEAIAQLAENVEISELAAGTT